MSRLLVWSAGTAALSSLFIISHSNYLLFHGLTELFSIVIAFGIFVIGWNSRDYYKNNYLLFIGIAYLYVAFFDTLHTLAYKGMNIFKEYDDNNLPPQIWLVARYLEALALLLAPCFFSRPVPVRKLVTLFTTISGLAVYAIFFAQIFPDCFVAGIGLTPFKVASEYVINGILLAALWMLHRNREHFDPDVLRLLTLSIACTIVTELCFTVYVHLYGISNLVGHFFKIFSFWFMYQAVIRTALTRPYDLLFRELRYSEERFKALSDASFGGIVIHDQGIILECNQGLSDISGFNYNDLIGMQGFGLIAPESLDTVLANVRNRFDQAYEVTGLRKDGSRYPLAIRGKQMTYQGRDVRVIEFLDITDRKRAEEALQRQNSLFSTLLKLIPIGVFMVEAPSGKPLVANAAALQLLGRGILPDATRQNLSEVYKAFKAGTSEPYPIEEMPILLGMEDIEAHVDDLEVECPDGTRRRLEIFGTPVKDEQGMIWASLVSFVDITERKRAEDERIAFEKQLLHAQKLESLGVLAGGIAHDFNNLLMAIMGNADLALMRLSKESPAIDNLRKIEGASARAADLAKQMLAYSGKGKFVVESLDLNKLIEEMLHMLEVSISKKVVLRLNPYHHLPAVEADATQMHQIIMNLVINASEAIGDKSGVIAITTGCMECSECYLQGAWLTDPIHEGLYAYLEIADTGCGMDKEILGKIFDPFFTTKFTGRGLGMAAVLGIVRGHKGAIRVYSEPDKGTTFKILLPASGRSAELFNREEVSDDWHGSGTVLLVDDEETVRAIGSEMLKELGFDVITACDGREAVETYQERPGISLVILDLTMPHLDGEQCFRELRMLDPGIQVIMSSGFSEQEVTQKFVGKGLAGFIQKPYKLSALKDAIRKANTMAREA